MSDPESTLAGETLLGIDVEAVTRWFESHLPGTEAPLEFGLISGGLSNLTYNVRDAAGSRYVLRRPPVKHLSKSAHDVGREFRLMLALAHTAVPVPAVAGFCSDDTVTGAQFYVMKFVPGFVLDSRETAERELDDTGRRAAGFDLVDVMAELHAIEPDSVGLGKLGQKVDYIRRQTKAWHKPYHSAPIGELREALEARIPDAGAPTIVHADFRLGNCLWNGEGRIQAVLDWETCTLGDPLADLAFNLVWWHDANRDFPPEDDPSTAPGFPTADELIERYAARSGRDLSALDFYLAFQSWRMACIVEDIGERFRRGAYGESRDISEYAGAAEGFTLSARDLLYRRGYALVHNP